jgi:hypothetical protein
MEKESIPAFNKFLQGYYDASGIIQESFDRAVQQGRLSPEMEARGMALAKSVDPAVYYIGFNMNDPTIGARAGERGRKLRQALSSASRRRRVLPDLHERPRRAGPVRAAARDLRFRSRLSNPFRTPDPDRARALLAEAGYKDGIDPQTPLPLRLTLDTARSLDARPPAVAVLRRRVAPGSGSTCRSPRPTTTPIRTSCAMAPIRSTSTAGSPTIRSGELPVPALGAEREREEPGAPNVSNFADPRFDALFLAMKDMPNGPERQQRIVEMRGILERERTVDRALLPGVVRALPRLELEREAARPLAPDCEVRRRRSGAAARTTRRVEPPDPVARVGVRRGVRADRRTGRGHLPAERQ